MKGNKATDLLGPGLVIQCPPFQDSPSPVGRSESVAALGCVQTIKCADLRSNTSSIVRHDRKFAVTYLTEKRLMLAAMVLVEPRLVAIGPSQPGASSP